MTPGRVREYQLRGDCSDLLAARLGDPEQLLHRLRCNRRVVVDAKNPITGRMPYPDVLAAREARVRGELDQAHVGELLADHLDRPVRRAIVDDDDVVAILDSTKRLP